MSRKLPYSLVLLSATIKKMEWTLTSPALLILLSLLFLNPAIANPQDEYFDDMITLNVGSYLKQEFYPVKSDFHGNIYLSIHDFLTLTELNEYCQLVINKDNIKLAMAASLFADAKARQLTKSFSQLNGLVIDKQLYLDKQGLSELFPLTAINWRAETYTLTISPNFNLPLEYRVAAQRRKRMIEADKSRKQSNQEAGLHIKDERKIVDLGMLKLRYDIDNLINFLTQNKEQELGDVEVEYSSQLLYGDFNLRHNLYDTGKLQNISLKYPYLLQDNTLTFGDNFITGNDILGYDSKIRGISISDSGYRIKRSGREITIRGEAPKNSLVEIYQNGKVADYQNVESKEYQFSVEMRSNSDAFKIKVYDRNGVLMEERSINVMQGNDFLSQGEWDYNFFYGQNPQGENNTWDDRKYGFAYGFTNNLSYFFDYYNTRNGDKLYRYAKHRTGYRFSNLSVPLMVSFDYYDSLDDSSKGYLGELQSEIFSHRLSYSYQYYTHLLATDENKDRYHEMEISGYYGKSDYFFRFSNKNYQGRIEKKYVSGLSYDISKALRMNLDLAKTVKKQTQWQSNQTAKIGINFTRGDFTYNFNTAYNQEQTARLHYKASLRKRLSKNNKYAYNVTVNYNKNDLFNLEIAFEYKFSPFLKMNYNYNSERSELHKVRSSYETVINLKKPFMANNAKDPNNSYLEGTIFIDNNGNGKQDASEAPLQGVGVRIGENKVTTNHEGFFYLSNVTPYKSNKLFYDYSGTMVDPTLRANSVPAVKLIPASGKKIDVGLTPLSLIMGSISLPEKTASKLKNKFLSYVEITVEKDGDYYASITPEYDGFFVVQDLKPGKYSLKINYLGSEKITLDKGILEVSVESGDTGSFYDGIDFKVSDIHSSKLRALL
jgi:hypothetical protein